MYHDAHLIMNAIVHIDPMSIMKLIMQNDYICGKNGWKIMLQKFAKFWHSLGETELTKHWQKVRPKFGRTESSVDHYDAL